MNDRPSNPLYGRPGLETNRRDGRALGKDVGILAKAHGLLGCVLISFTGERVGVNSSGEGAFLAHMERLGDRILAAIDDGQFDPEPESTPPDGEKTESSEFRVRITASELESIVSTAQTLASREGKTFVLDHGRIEVVPDGEKTGEAG